MHVDRLLHGYEIKVTFTFTVTDLYLSYLDLLPIRQHTQGKERTISYNVQLYAVYLEKTITSSCYPIESLKCHRVKLRVEQCTSINSKERRIAPLKTRSNQYQHYYLEGLYRSPILEVGVNSMTHIGY